MDIFRVLVAQKFLVAADPTRAWETLSISPCTSCSIYFLLGCCFLVCDHGCCVRSTRSFFFLSFSYFFFPQAAARPSGFARADLWGVFYCSFFQKIRSSVQSRALPSCLSWDFVLLFFLRHKILLS